MISFTVPGKPISTNQAYRVRGSRWYITREGVEFKMLVAARARAAARKAKIRELLEDYSRVEIEFFFESRRPDIDGPVKLVLDALQGSVIRNDRQVRSLEIFKVVDAKRPRVEIRVGMDCVCQGGGFLRISQWPAWRPEPCLFCADSPWGWRDKAGLDRTESARQDALASGMESAPSQGTKAP